MFCVKYKSAKKSPREDIGRRLREQVSAVAHPLNPKVSFLSSVLVSRREVEMRDPTGRASVSVFEVCFDEFCVAPVA